MSGFYWNIKDKDILMNEHYSVMWEGYIFTVSPIGVLKLMTLKIFCIYFLLNVQQYAPTSWNDSRNIGSRVRGCSFEMLFLSFAFFKYKIQSSYISQWRVFLWYCTENVQIVLRVSKMNNKKLFLSFYYWCKL